LPLDWSLLGVFAAISTIAIGVLLGVFAAISTIGIFAAISTIAISD